MEEGGLTWRFSWRRICFQAHIVVGNNSLWVAGQRASVSYGLLAGGWLQLLAVCSSPYDNIKHGSLLLQSQQGKESLLARHIKIFVTQSRMGNHIHPITLAIFYCLETSHMSHLHSSGGDYVRVWTPGDGDRVGHPGICLPRVEKFEKKNLKLLLATSISAIIVYQSRSTDEE